MTRRSVLIKAPAESIYRLVADPMRMAEWSPECARCRWTGRIHAAQVGARFRGTSRNGRRRWTTTSTVVEMRPNEVFAWQVSYFRRPVARWEYRLQAAPDGIELVESVEDRRGPVLRAVSPLITGSPDRDERNAETMATTLLAVKAAAEGTSG
ncbi:MAG TPA: SRPBCC family protein [Acidimicrobiales bacterium]|nr:SRPBCC family protein [Acidimicrobiales bacterium]